MEFLRMGQQIQIKNGPTNEGTTRKMGYELNGEWGIVVGTTDVRCTPLTIV